MNTLPTNPWKIKSAFEYGPFDYWAKGIYTEEGKKAHDRMANAAPDLLEALREMVKKFEGCYADGEPSIIKAKAAIAKATKEQP